ncbi:hypothetical protein ASG49_00035 [Marmoricola sp. Leaf446]|uniref:hypothetical protein n=1 Tax=Marmoricola sp. Leaf446 TaxID=1736379 RepID=UPI0006F32D27|nr:hypothetical protein [Marmoricola sp. Leaf446]KQT93461.1 hypothetical protein ASG49_00035 [Marmoricola sp. Leaf446]
MGTLLLRTDLGPVSLLAPDTAPRHVRATYGHLWQWTGDGSDLFSLSVAARETRLGTATGARHHLNHELTQLRPGPEPGSDTLRETHVGVFVEGAAASAADQFGEVRGNLVHQRVVVTTDGELMHVVRILVPDDEAGAELVERVTRSLRVRPWSLTA